MKLVFGGLIAVILLGLYAYSVVVAIALVMGFYTNVTPSPFTSGFSSTLTTVGGLVAALVIAELAITKPGESPGIRTFEAAIGDAPSDGQRLTVKLVSSGYVFVWIALGLASYVVGNLWYPGKLPDLTFQGQSWLGLAIAAAYAYFGLTPSPENKK